MSGMGGEDLFGDSDGDTDELIASSKVTENPPAARKKNLPSGKIKRLQKSKSAAGRKKIPDADNDPDSDEEKIDSEDEAAALFDSEDSDDDGDGGNKKRAKSPAPKKATFQKLSKREKMEALKAKKRATSDNTKTVDSIPDDPEERQRRSEERKAKGYDSSDSYDSGQFVRTKEDDDFIDDDDENPDALRELYREQHFDDERPSGDDTDEEEGQRRGGSNKRKKSSGKKRGPDALDFDLNGDEEPDNPIMAAVYRMKKKKKEVKKLSELEDLAKEFLSRMERAADEDDVAFQERRPGLKKLAMLSETVDILTKREMMRPLLEFDLLLVAKRWVQPLPNGLLGNVTVRQRLLDSIGKMNGEQGVTANDLKRSSFGKVVMSLYMHKSETPEMKRQLKTLIEQWSRPIFQKSGNMRDLEKVQSIRRGETGLTGIARAQAAAAAEQSSRGGAAASSERGRNEQDLTSIIATGAKNSRDIGNNRVRVPYSKGFQFTVRPNSKTGDVQDKRGRISSMKEGRDALHKRMIEKTRPVSKNQRSANISIEGKPTK